MTIRTYYLHENTVNIQSLLYSPYRHSLAWREDASLRVDRYRITRVTEYVLGLLTLLFAYPLKIAGDFIERYAEQIPVKLYEEESAKWRMRFKSRIDHKVCQENIIEVLIKSRIRQEDCPFQHILLTFMQQHTSGRLIAPDGKEPGFIPYINENPSQCLIIGYTNDIQINQPGASEQFKNRQIPAYDWDLQFQKKLPQVNWFWLGMDWLQTSSPSFRQQIVSLFKTSLEA